MLSEQDFMKMVTQIEAQGIDHDTAAHYAALIGDMPIRDDQGNLVVMDGTQEIARIKMIEMFS